MPALVPILIAAFLITACGPAPQPAELRFLDAGPVPIFAAEAVSHSETVFSWRFATPQDLEPWSGLGDDGALRIDDGTLTGVYEPPPSRLVRAVDFAADAVDTFRVELDAHPPRGMLFWSRAGENFAPKQRIALQCDAAVCTFQVGTHPEWSGRIGRLRFMFTPRPGTRFRLRRIEGLRQRVDGERLATAATQPWMVELDHELRRALLIPGKTFYERELDVPEDAELELAYGLLATGSTSEQPAHLEIEARSASGEPETLFSTPLDETRWRPARVDLDAFSGRRLLLRFSTRGPPTAAAVIADPWVRSRGRLDPRPDVILISIDTLRADRLSLYGYPRETSPAIDGWARRSGVTFRSAVTASSWTLASHASLFSGVDALRHGANYPESRAPSDLLTLAEILRREGYETIAITGGGFLHPRYGLVQGFDRYRYWASRAGSEDELSEHLERALELLEDRDRPPLLLLFHTYEVHTPYRAREPFFSRLGGDLDELPTPFVRVQMLAPRPEDGFAIRRQLMWRQTNTGQETPVVPTQAALISDLYDSGVAYADAQIGRLLERLGGPGRESLVVLTSDHGESLGEHGLWGHNTLYDDNLMVPLILSFPGRLDGGREIDAQVRTIDLLPTVLELLELPVPGDLDGVSLLPLIEGGTLDPRPAWSVAAWSNHGVALRLENARKLIVKNVPWPPLAGRKEFYDLTRDPAELDDRGAVPAAAELRRRLERHLAEHAGGWHLRIANAGSATYRLDLAGPVDLPYRLKTITAPCAAVSWREDRATIDVPPACTAMLRLEGGARARLELTTGDGGGSFVVELDPDRARVHALRLDRGRWRLDGDADPVAVGLTISWQTPQIELDSGLQPATGALRNQLETLGYLE